MESTKQETIVNADAEPVADDAPKERPAPKPRKGKPAPVIMPQPEPITGVGGSAQ